MWNDGPNSVMVGPLLTIQSSCLETANKICTGDTESNIFYLLVNAFVEIN